LTVIVDGWTGGEDMTTFEIACFVEMTQAAAAKVVRM